MLPAINDTTHIQTETTSSDTATTPSQVAGETMLTFRKTRMSNRSKKWRPAHHSVIAVLGLLVGLLLAPVSKAADCYYGPTRGLQPDPYVYTYSTNALAKMNPAVPVGAILGSFTTAIVSGRPNPEINCPGGFTYSFVGVGTPQLMDVTTSPLNPVPLLPRRTGASVYPTGIAGIGYIVMYMGGGWPGYQAEYNITISRTKFLFTQYMTTYTVWFVKTGEITAGGVLSGEFGNWVAHSAIDGDVTYIKVQYSAPVPVTPDVPACTVTTPSLNASLGTVAASGFRGAGSTAGTPATVTISLSCSGGVAATVTNMYMTMTDATDPGNTSNLLSLTGDSSATGIKVQLNLADNSIVSYGPDSSAAGNTNQFFVKEVAFGVPTVNIPVTARYIATGEPITPGKADAMATFTMSYQ